MDVRHDEGLKEPVSNGIWPEESLARVPYWVYQDEANYKREMERLFEAATWNFVCLEADIPDKGDYRTNHVGIMPVIAVRGADGSINCFENRCSHRGALIAFDDGGNVGNQFRCVYHSWSYDLAGNLRGMGRFVQPLPNNWKLYVENVKDTYHASILHTFLTTFRISRLTQGGGVLVSADGGSHSSYTIAMPEGANANAYKEQQIRSDQDGRFSLADPSVLESVEEFGDHIQLQILSVFPGFILQQIHNCLAVRHVVPRGVGKMDLVWTYFGFEDDTPEMNRRRLKQQNLVGPAGFISMEDGCIGGFVQRGTAAAADEVSVIEMGGSTTESQATRATEASVRGFWKAYRRYMGY